MLLGFQQLLYHTILIFKYVSDLQLYLLAPNFQLTSPVFAWLWQNQHYSWQKKKIVRKKHSK
jgi:hypothetical protein